MIQKKGNEEGAGFGAAPHGGLLPPATQLPTAQQQGEIYFTNLFLLLKTVLSFLLCLFLVYFKEIDLWLFSLLRAAVFRFCILFLACFREQVEREEHGDQRDVSFAH